MAVRTPHFVVKTSLPRVQAIETADHLERTRAAMLQAAWGRSKGPPSRAEVIVFGRQPEFARFVDTYIAGETRGAPELERLIVFSRDPSLSIPTIASHELAHQLSSWYMPIQPRWLSEGLATFLETIRVRNDTQRGTTLCTVGIAPGRSNYLEWQADFDSAKLFQGAGRLASDVEAAEGFYAQSWLLVRYLLEEHADAFAAFQRDLAGMMHWRTAFDRSMPSALRDPQTLNAHLAEYWAARKQWVVARETIQLERYEPEVRPLSPASVRGMFSRLALYRRNDAEQQANEALQLDPTELTALRTKFYLASTMPERAELAQRALAAHPSEVDAWLMTYEASTTEREALAALQQAIRVDPTHPRVQAALGLAYVKTNRAKLALPYLRFALHRLAPSERLLGAYITALAANDRCDLAATIFDGYSRHERNINRGLLERALIAANHLCTPAAKTP
jgi:hypothetical protein